MKTLRIRTVEGIIGAMDVLYEDARAYLEDPHHAKRGVTLTLGTVDNATWDQRVKVKAMCGELAKQTKLHGQVLDKDSWSAVMIAAYRKDAKTVQGIDGGLVLLGGSTKELSLREASDVIEIIYEFGSRQEPPVVFKEKKKAD